MSAPAELLAAAVAARRLAYAPYSNFFVGAALRAPDGTVFKGANVENASYGLSMCAERVAIYSAIAAGVHRFEAVAVSGPDGIRTMPCGACRQVLYEFGPQMNVIYADGGELVTIPLAELLPGAFSGAVLDTAREAGSAARDLR